MPIRLGLLAVVLATTVAVDRAEGSPPVAARSERSIPQWTYDARWYGVVVSRFRNGDESNDPAGAIPWPKKSGAAVLPSQSGSSPGVEREYGGDLQGVAERLSYIKELGFNTILLMSVFPDESNGRAGVPNGVHVDDSLGVKDSRKKLVGEVADPESWKFSGSDRLMLSLISQAHQADLRVVVELSPDPRLSDGGLKALVRRWQDPDGDGNTSDGVDGWFFSSSLKNPGRQSYRFLEHWRKLVKAIDADAVLVGDLGGVTSPFLNGDQVDLMFNRPVAAATRRFLSGVEKGYSLPRFVDDMNKSTAKTTGPQHAAPIQLSSADSGRLLTVLSLKLQPGSDGTSGSQLIADRELGAARWRMATVLQYFLPGTPMLLYGDEAGMNTTKGDRMLSPMPWNDSSKPPSISTNENFIPLVRWLNTRREVHSPLRRGDFRTVLVDERQQVWAFSRSVPGDEVILVANFSSSKQQVILEAGKPGQLVGVLSPLLTPRSQQGKAPAAGGLQKLDEIKPIRMGGSRQYVDTGGHVRVWVRPMSVRVVLVRPDATWANPGK